MIINIIGKTLILKEKAIRTAKQIMANRNLTDLEDETEFNGSKKSSKWNEADFAGFGGLLFEEDDSIGDDSKSKEQNGGVEEYSQKEEGDGEVHEGPPANTGKCIKHLFNIQ